MPFVVIFELITTIQAHAAPKALPPLVPANGVYDYTVAADYYYGSSKLSPSLYSDLNNPSYSNSNVQYVFPDFVYLNAIPQSPYTSPQTLTTQDQCPNGPSSNTTFNLINYFAVPIINPVIYYGVLGGCQSGQAVTAYYSSINKNIKVIPHVSYRVDDNAGSDFGGYIARLYDPTNSDTLKTSTSNIQAVADKVAELISNDPNAFGVAFDNEPAIGNVKIHGPNGPAAELIFFQEIASQLLNQGKYLFVYDANATMKTLWENNNLKNTVILEPLYDFGENNFNPDTVISMQNEATKYATNFLIGNSAGFKQPVMFVVPASATSTYWEYSNIYNVAPETSPFIPSINQSATCPQPSASSIAYQALNASLVTGETLQMFYNSCKTYTNTYKSSMTDYFNATLTGVKSAKNSPPSANSGGSYLGVAMYAWRIHDYNDIDGFKGWGGNFVNFKNSNKVFISKNDNGPADITPSIWSALGSWQSSLSLARHRR